MVNIVVLWHSFFIFYLYDMTVESRQEVKWEKEREGDRIRKGPQAGIRTWDARNTMPLHVGTLAH